METVGLMYKAEKIKTLSPARQDSHGAERGFQQQNLDLAGNDATLCAL